MRRIWILIALATVALPISLPQPAVAGTDCWATGGCGEVRDGLDPRLSTNPLNWKCVKADHRPAFPWMPVCPMKGVEMNKPVEMPITFGPPVTPGETTTAGATQGK